MPKSKEPYKAEAPKSTLKNDCFIRALNRQTTDRTPVWIMRQAGRYLPEYRMVRAKAGSFLKLCKTPELACEVTCQPLERFPLDAAIIFSDILTLPDAFDLGLKFETGEGPRFSYPARDEKTIRNLPMIEPRESLQYVMDAIRLTKKTLDGKVPLIGFAGSPWTVGTYMVEGGSSKNFSIIKAMMYQRPDLLKYLLNHLACLSAQYLLGQIEAGADAVMIFDTWGGILNQEHFLEFSLHYSHIIISQLKASAPHIPVVLFSKNGGRYLPAQADCGVHGLGLDWTADLHRAREQVGHLVALQGNLDPSALYAPLPQLKLEIKKVLRAFGPGSGHVFNLGHGIYPNIDPEQVGALVHMVHEESALMRRA